MSAVAKKGGDLILLHSSKHMAPVVKEKASGVRRPFILVADYQAVATLFFQVKSYLLYIPPQMRAALITTYSCSCSCTVCTVQRLLINRVDQAGRHNQLL